MQYNPQSMPFLPYKNLTTSLLFSIFLGPLGLLYATTRGGIMMLIIAFVVISCKLPVPIMIMWVSCSVWSTLATNRYNHQLFKARGENHEHEEKGHPSRAAG